MPDNPFKNRLDDAAGAAKRTFSGGFVTYRMSSLSYSLSTSPRDAASSRYSTGAVHSIKCAAATSKAYVDSDASRIPAAIGVPWVGPSPGSDITGQIYVYYKSSYGDLYIGGITYRTGVSGLAAGASTTLYASHYSTAYSRIMFVTYVQ